MNKQNLKEFSLDINGLNKEELSQKFKSLAQTILSGYFKICKNESVVKILPTCVEIYCHAESNNDIKDYIVYHRNANSKERSIFPKGVLHNHISGIDITFEEGNDPAHAIRLSALIREFKIDDSGKKEDNYRMDQFERRNWVKGDIIKYPTSIYDAIYSQFSVFDGGFNVAWEDGNLIDINDIEENYRINVAEYIFENDRIVKKKCDGSNCEKTTSGYCQDTRKWQFRNKQAYQQK